MCEHNFLSLVEEDDETENVGHTEACTEASLLLFHFPTQNSQEHLGIFHTVPRVE